jgi:hypothetical protein
MRQGKISTNCPGKPVVFGDFMRIISDPSDRKIMSSHVKFLSGSKVASLIGSNSPAQKDPQQRRRDSDQNKDL